MRNTVTEIGEGLHYDRERGDDEDFRVSGFERSGGASSNWNITHNKENYIRKGLGFSTANPTKQAQQARWM